MAAEFDSGLMETGFRAQLGTSSDGRQYIQVTFQYVGIAMLDGESPEAVHEAIEDAMRVCRKGALLKLVGSIPEVASATPR